MRSEGANESTRIWAILRKVCKLSTQHLMKISLSQIAFSVTFLNSVLCGHAENEYATFICLFSYTYGPQNMTTLKFEHQIRDNGLIKN